jgi:hypothetical protein
MHFKLMEKQEYTKPKTRRWRKIIRIKTEIKTKITIQRINETKSWFFEKINKINKHLANIPKWRREKTQINKIRDEKEDITTIANKIHRSLESTLKTYI